MSDCSRTHVPVNLANCGLCDDVDIASSETEADSTTVSDSLQSLSLENAHSAVSAKVRRARVEDAQESARELRERLSAMDVHLVAELVDARKCAEGISTVFPNGDERFKPVDSDDEDNDGWEEPGEQDSNSSDVEEEACQGLLDGEIDSGPRQALGRAKEQYGFDLVAEMDEAGLDFLERVRLVNFMRSKTREKHNAVDVIHQFRGALKSGRGSGVLADDRFLKPTIEGDILLTILQDVREDDEDDEDDEDVAEAVYSAIKF